MSQFPATVTGADFRLRIANWGIGQKIPNPKHQNPNKLQFSKHQIQNNITWRLKTLIFQDN
jgi:hypothetical protein